MPVKAPLLARTWAVVVVAAALVVVLAAAGVVEARPAAKKAAAEPADDPLVREVVMSLFASAVEPPGLEALARAGLNAVHDKHECLRVLKKDALVRVVCKGESVEASWPPADELAVARLLTRAIDLVATASERPRLAQHVSRSLASSLGDPYTAYLPPEVVAKLETDQRSMLASPGIELSPKDPSRIRDVRPGSDAAKEKLREGDRIVAVDHAPAGGLTYAELNAMLVGVTGSTVRLDVVPFADKAERRRTVILGRSLLPEQTVDAEELPNGVLYVRLAVFSPGVARRVTEEIWDRRSSAIVLDLRHNQGGLIQEGVELLDVFFAEGNIGGVRPRKGRPGDEFRAAHQATDVATPLVVLIDGGSASASELVAMVLKERKRAVIVGSPSIGKGSVQKVIRMPDGGVLRVTSAHYTGPSGSPLGIGGVQPHKYLAPPTTRTVLEGGNASHDSWVLSALDVLEGQERLTVGSQQQGVYGPMP